MSPSDEGVAAPAVRVDLVAVRRLWFDDGRPVRAASGIAPLGDGWVVAQDDTTSVAWWRPEGIVPVRLVPPVHGLDAFSEAEGTKRLKPDFETACALPATQAGEDVVVVLGSGSLPRRMRGAMVRQRPAGGLGAVATDLTGLYTTVRRALGVTEDQLNLEGACVVGPALRWFQRGLERQGVASGSVDVELAGLLAALHGHLDPARVEVDRPRTITVGTISGHALEVTDAAVLPDGRVVVAAAAEDAPDPVADGPVVAAAVAVLEGEQVSACLALPASPDGGVWKVEGLAVRAVAGQRPGGTVVDLLGVVDLDDPAEASPALELRLHLPG